MELGQIAQQGRSMLYKENNSNFKCLCTEIKVFWLETTPISLIASSSALPMVSQILASTSLHCAYGKPDCSRASRTVNIGTPHKTTNIDKWNWIANIQHQEHESHTDWNLTTPWPLTCTNIYVLPSSHILGAFVKKKSTCILQRPDSTRYHIISSWIGSATIYPSYVHIASALQVFNFTCTALVHCPLCGDLLSLLHIVQHSEVWWHKQQSAQTHPQARRAVV